MGVVEEVCYVNKKIESLHQLNPSNDPQDKCAYLM